MAGVSCREGAVLRRPSDARIAHAKSLHPGLRVITARGERGQIIAPGHRVNAFGYVPLWLIRVDDSAYNGCLPVWADELEVLE